MSRMVFAMGAILFFCAYQYKDYYHDYIDRQATNHAFVSFAAYAKAHPTEIQNAKLNEVFLQERAACLKATRFQRLGLDVTCWIGLAMQAWPVWSGIRQSRRSEALT